MLKSRNVVIIFVLNYVVLVFVSAFIEIYTINSKARDVVETMRTAADMALDQTQSIDEYLTSANSSGYQISVPDKSGAGFIKSDVYTAMLGIDTSTPGGKEQVFDRLYNNNDFKMVASRASVMKTPVKYWDSPSTNRFLWYYMPTVNVVGNEIFPVELVDSKLRVENANGVKLTSSWSSTILSAYGVDKKMKKSGDKDYYNTPLAYGVTYLNEELLSRLFVNNMDNLMRYKYTSENLNTPEGGNGLLRGSTYSNRINSSEVALAEAGNIINNGSFSFVRGTRVSTSGSTDAFNGVVPQIQYKVIDMYDSKNDRVLKYLFGSNTNGFNSKAEYLKSLDSSRINPVTNRPWDKKPFVVAKVTFYADIYVPYFTLVFRDFASKLNSGGNNFIDIKDTGTNADGSRTISYTRFFAVSP